MFRTTADKTAGEDSIDPRPGIHLIDVDTGLVTYPVLGNTSPHERRIHTGHPLLFEPITQQKSHNR
jgi:hypothetical protein